MLAHNVYFQLNDNSDTAQIALVADCHKYLGAHSGTLHFFVGRRYTDFSRDVNDLNFDVSLNIVFEDQAAHDAYQAAPRHHEFIEKNESNWKHVRVFDSRLIE